MFNRVGAALSRFVSPISSSRNDLAVRPDTEKGEERRFERHQARRESSPSEKDSTGEEAPQERPKLRVIKAGTLDGLATDAAAQPPPDGEPAPAPDARAEPPVPGLSVSHAFLNLMRSIQQGRTLFAQWFGRGEYRKVQRNQRKGAKVRKGAMLDQKAE